MENMGIGDWAQSPILFKIKINIKEYNKLIIK